MTARRIRAIAAFLAFALPVLHADALDDVLSRMDRFAKDYKSFAAKMTRVDYQKLFDESTTAEGTVRMQKTKDGLQGIMDFSGADAQTVYIDGRTAGILHIKANVEDVFDVGKKGASLEQIILLGFGSSKADLLKDYDIALGGAEPLGSQATTRIVLTPKSKDEKNMVTKIELWIPDGLGYPLQEKITKPSKDTTQFTYKDLHTPAPPGTQFKFTAPAGVKKNYPQR